MQSKRSEKGEKQGRTLGKHTISLYSTGISQMVKIRNAKELQQDLENNNHHKRPID